MNSAKKEDPKEHIVFRVPLIPNFNTQKDVEKRFCFDL